MLTFFRFSVGDALRFYMLLPAFWHICLVTYVETGKFLDLSRDYSVIAWGWRSTCFSEMINLYWDYS
jgi:hypothetical protein